MDFDEISLRKTPSLLSSESLSDNSLEIKHSNDLSVSSSSFSFGECRICTDKASGIHYGVASCEGCKGFFKRGLNKYLGFICVNQHKCTINKITRNRCKSCRFKKCLKKGMSIDGIKMGRISKNTKEKVLNNLSKNNDRNQHESDDDDDEDVSATKLNKINCQALQAFKGLTNRSLNSVYERTQFIDWLRPQLVKSQNNELRTNLRLSLQLNYANNNYSTESMFDFLKSNHLFDPLTVMPRTIFQNDVDFTKIVLVKNRIIQIYKYHIKKSKLINSTYERLKNKDYIDMSTKEIKKETIISGMLGTFIEETEWINSLIRDLNTIGKKELCIQDLTTITIHSTYMVYALHFDRFIRNNESFGILSNSIKVSRDCLNKLYGKNLTDLIFEFHINFKRLELTENETALYTAFVLTSCNPDLMIDKENYLQIQAIFKKALIYEFELNRRDSVFLKHINELFSICNVMESNRVNYEMCLRHPDLEKMFRSDH